MEFHAEASSPVVTIISLAITVFLIAAQWKIFTKAGEEGWKVLIPFYNLYTEYKIFWGKGWMFLLTAIPVVNVVVTIMLLNKMSKSFGRGVGTTIGLLLLPVIFFPILGFGSDEFQGIQ